MLILEKMLKWRIYEGVIYRANFKISTIEKVLEKFKDDNNDLMQNFDKFVMNSLNGVQIRRNIDDFYEYKPEHWMHTERDDNVSEYWRLTNGNYSVKRKKRR